MSHPPSFGRYKILRELGQGAMGKVFLAYDPEIDRQVAIKTVHLAEGVSREEREEALTRFRQEVRAAGKLAHTNIVTIYDLGLDPAQGMFIAMEYVEGESLAEHTAPDRLLDAKLVAMLAAQAASALAYAHRQGIVHRDIKPANLLLVGGGAVKIADFGLAKQGGASMTQAGTLLGTPYYMSPEQVRGLPVDGRSDLFSLAVVVYELLTGTRPFRGDSISSVIYRIVHAPPVEPSLGRLPGAARVKMFLGRALAKRPEDRFPDGDDFARALREAFEAGAQPAPAPAPPAREATRGQAVRPAGTTAAPARRVRRVSATPFVLAFLGLIMLAFLWKDTLLGWVLREGSGLAPAYESGKSPGEELEAGAGLEATPRGEPQGESNAAPGSTGTLAEPQASGDGAAWEREPIRLLSSPPGATFTAGGREIEGGLLTSPASGEALEVQAVLGCSGAKRELTAADAGGGPVMLELAPLKRAVRVVSRPEGARVTIGGERRGQTPLDIAFDGCEARTIDLTLHGHRPHQLALAALERLPETSEEITAELEPIPRGTLEVPTPPYAGVSDWRITLDGGRTLRPGERVSLEEATYKLMVSSETILFNAEMEVAVRGGKEAEPRIEFPPLAMLTIRAQPGNATIEVVWEDRTRDLGSPPIFDQPLVARTYKVRCKFAHNNEVQERAVTLKAGANDPVDFVAGRS